MKKILFLILATVFVSTAQAEAFNPKQKPIDIVIGYQAGGAADKVARTIEQIFTDNGWKSSVVYKPGGDSRIAASYVAKAPADGYTIYISGNTVTDGIILKKFPNLDYSLDSFSPIVGLGQTTAVLVANVDVPINNYKEFKNYVKLNPTQFNLGVFNTGGNNVLNEWASREDLPAPNIIPYKGSVAQTTDLMGGRLPFTIDNISNVAQLQKAGKVKIIATLSSNGDAFTTRIDKSLTVFEIGKKYPDLDTPFWFGLFCPAGTPPETIAEINKLVNQGFKSKRYDTNLENLYLINIGGSPEKLHNFQKNYVQIMEKINLK